MLCGQAAAPPTESEPDPDWLIAMLVAAEPEERARAYLALSERATEQDLATLHGALATHPSSRARWRVARVIGRLGSSESMRPLAVALGSDDSYYVRRNAAWALGDLGDPAACEPLYQAMTGDEDISVRKRAATALNRICGPPAATAIRQAIADEQDLGVKVALRWLLDSRTRPPTQRPAIRRGRALWGSYLGTRYLLYVPQTRRGAGPSGLLVSVHGTDGTPEAYLEMCVEDAERYGLVVLAPWFDYPTFPNYDTLNLELGAPRSDLRLLEIIEEVSSFVPIRTDRFFLFGHSRGGQFVQRFVRAHPQRVQRAAACGSGSYVRPGVRLLFPDGDRPNPLAPDIQDPAFTTFVQSPLAIVVGTEELQRRLDEAERFAREVRSYAKENELACNIGFFSVPGGGHSGRNNYPTAARFLFSENRRQPRR
ncbi:MAG: HEAT repeat domain-containing protein [Planctomycetota bacterium]|jgi:pimeloyl-ACP methyl ester carboxylesterase